VQAGDTPEAKIWKAKEQERKEKKQIILVNV